MSINERNAAALHDALRVERGRVDAALDDVRGLRAALDLLRSEVASLRHLVHVQRAGTGPTVRE